MQAWAELVGAVLFGLVVAVLGLAGVDVTGEPRESDPRSVRRVPISADVTAPTRSEIPVTIACDNTSGHA